MAPKKQNSRPAPLGQDEFQVLLHEQIRQAVRLALTTVLEAEVDALVGALPCERTPTRRDQRNEYYTRGLGHHGGLH